MVPSNSMLYLHPALAILQVDAMEKRGMPRLCVEEWGRIAAKLAAIERPAAGCHERMKQSENRLLASRRPGIRSRLGPEGLF